LKISLPAETRAAAAAELWTARVASCSASREMQLCLTVPVPAGSRLHSVTCNAWLTGQCLQKLNKHP